MSVVKIAFSENPYEIFPRSTLQDNNLDLATLGALCRLYSLPKGWEFYMYKVEEILGVGRDARKRIFKVLDQNGYLNATKSRLPNGKWQWHFTIFAEPQPKKKTIDGFSVDGSAVDGSTADGQSVDGEGVDKDKPHPDKPHIEKPQPLLSPASQKKDDGVHGSGGDYAKESPPKLPPAVTVDDFFWPSKIDEHIQQEILQILMRFPHGEGQRALYQWAARSDVNDPIRWITGVLNKGVRPTPAGLEIEAGRNRRAAVKAQQQETLARLNKQQTITPRSITSERSVTKILNEIRDQGKQRA